MEPYIENFTKMMSGSLGLVEPWHVAGAQFREAQREVHIYVEVRKGALLCCPVCGAPADRFGYENKGRVWRHGDTMFYPTYVHCRRPKIKCKQCGVKQLNGGWERKNSRFTLLFEGYAMLLLPDMPVDRAARALRCDYKSLVSIMRYWVTKSVDSTDLSDLINLAIDETSNKRGQDYVTLIIDALRRRVIDVERGRDAETVKLFTEKLVEKGGNPLRIKTITSDMSKAYLSAAATYFPEAENIIDKFHVKKVLIDALDKVRREEQKGVKNKTELFRGRRLFMIPKAKATAGQAAKLAEMSKRYPKTGRAYRIVAGLDDFYACRSPDEAGKSFDSLYSWMRRCRLEPMKIAAETLKNHKAKILAYFRDRLTNAICEGINSMVQAAKRKARGYATFEGFSCMIYLVAGKLQLAVPSPF